MLKIDTDVSIDTVRLYWYCIINIDYNKWHRIGKDAVCYRSLIYPIRFIYNYHTYILISEFSASGLANGYNAVPYTYGQYPMIKDCIESAVFEATGKQLLLENARISRIDIYRSIRFDSIVKTKDFVRALSMMPKSGKIKKKLQGVCYRCYKQSGTTVDKRRGVNAVNCNREPVGHAEFHEQTDNDHPESLCNPFI